MIIVVTSILTNIRYMYMSLLVNFSRFNYSTGHCHVPYVTLSGIPTGKVIGYFLSRKIKILGIVPEKLKTNYLF